MLILSRREGEKIIITIGNIAVEVAPIEINRNQVKMGINAPPSVTVHREEIAAKIEKERRS